MKKQYKAFISYSRTDKKWAEWLHRELESYTISNSVRNISGSPLKNFRPVFMDQTDIRLGHLNTTLTDALAESEFLIVVCSPNSAKSEWVDKEIQFYLQQNKESHIIPFIISGTPRPIAAGEASCYPPNLNNEILGASLVEMSKEKALHKIIAFMLGIDFDVLWQRKKRKRRVRIITVIAISLLLIAAALLSYQPFMKQSFISKAEKSEIPGLNEAFLEANKNLERIRSFTIDEDNIAYIDDLSKYCKSIDTLTVKLTGIKDLRILKPFHSVSTIYLLENDDLSGLSGIEAFENLKTLLLYSHASLKSLKGLERAKQLDSLSLSYNHKLSDFNELKAIPNLKTLILGANRELKFTEKDISELRSLRAITLPPQRIDTLVLKRLRPDIEITSEY